MYIDICELLVQSPGLLFAIAYDTVRYGLSSATNKVHAVYFPGTQRSNILTQ